LNLNIHQNTPTPDNKTNGVKAIKADITATKKSNNTINTINTKKTPFLKGNQIEAYNLILSIF